MGSGYYGGYHNTSGANDDDLDETSNIDDNARDLAREFRLTTGGYFGQKGNGKGVRIISSTDPLTTAEHCYQVLGKGGSERTAYNSKG
ncbi:hypothetical protein [Bifidobacterium stellenboschense]|uniref:Uncharacterized protein n=1 Tax=Bifidobacterium stellenboschense TaxID=762211 RepID=A0A087DGE7_9BIFI|nr:hypothetical protein [Bifidobacterium stellenboschense]KFI94597.1 hypothetical protein BSTEL_1267 [Bifidobacterium stellenboschense]